VNILALDSATEACSAALLRADGEVFGEFQVAPRQHAQLLPQMMDRVLAAAAVPKSMLSHCAFSNGPGAFTGIRIAAALAQGIGIGLGIPLLPISTLATLAQTSLDRYPYDSTLVALDARMQELYWAIYRRDSEGCAQLQGIERLSAIADLRLDAKVESGAGHGWLAELRTGLDLPIDHELLPDARSLLRLARQAVRHERGCDASRISINYLRNRVAEKARS
jgi:tRNA threonylcarbamoyladenosine biosynthesis protein TsaB